MKINKITICSTDYTEQKINYIYEPQSEIHEYAHYEAYPEEFKDIKEIKSKIIKDAKRIIEEPYTSIWVDVSNNKSFCITVWEIIEEKFSDTIFTTKK